MFLSLANPIRNRRWIAAFCAVIYIVACSGFSLPVPVPKYAGPEDAQPYPCQHHNCGCSNAEQCWNNCCCMTMSQRLAWAKANGVTPPPSALAQSIETDESRPSACCSGCCASQGRSEYLANSHNAPANYAATCGSTTARSPMGLCCGQRPQPKQNSKADSIRWINFMQAQKCSGQILDWLVAGATTVPAPPLAFDFDFTVTWMEEACPLLPASVLPPPDAPPPRGILV